MNRYFEERIALLQNEERRGIARKTKAVKGRLSQITCEPQTNAGDDRPRAYTLTITRGILKRQIAVSGYFDCDLRSYFRPGDDLVYYPNHELPVNLSNTSGQAVCIDCGTLVSRKHAHCPHCGCVVL